MSTQNKKQKSDRQVGAILKIANSVYPGGYIANYFNMKTGARLPRTRDGEELGDTLALFIGLEIQSCTEEGFTLEENKEQVQMALERAREELTNVINALSE